MKRKERKTNFLVDKICLYCNKNFLAETRELNRGRAKYCSQSCAQRNKINTMPRPIPNVKCGHCGVEFYLNESKRLASKSKFYFCCREHKDLSQRLGGIKEIMPPHYGTARMDNPYIYRNIAFADKPKICERCNFANEKAIIVHHKDRNRLNADKNNLEVLCYNCHVIEHFEEYHAGRSKLKLELGMISYEI